MEYGEAISAPARARALAIAGRKLAAGRTDLRAVAAESVAEAYCTCVVDGEDAAEGRLSPIHAKLIEQLESQLAEQSAPQGAS